ncbi:MAG: bifunctional UDP-N-acetylglucosamine diphosphorylase/glucosamine-1-phosphate N-acetyltransferase GlmU [Deltaproteobacteria bacterium]|nr:bifunctional UDP-N-acetylglucosamine diphosphorylase/glucosamine-1-phosphate N-acetyltransferase GlmU [Deltaproteobacteria bacterium]
MNQESPLVLIMAAGLGTRMKSDRSKVLHELAGRSMIAWVVEAARSAGAGRVVAILGHQHEQVKAHLDARYGAGVIGVALQAEQKGTGHAVRCALPALEREPDDRIVVILSGDAPLLRSERIAQLTTACAASPAGMALLSTIPDRPMPYGRLVRDDAGKLLRIVEHVDATPAEREIKDTNAGFYAVRLGHLRADLATLQANNAKGELYLTDLVARAAARGGATAIDAPFEECSGINDRVDLAAVDAAARRRINADWMRAGVTFVDPAATYVDADVGPIGQDVWIGPGVCLRGKTSIGARTRIDVGCIITDTTVADDVNLKPYSIFSEAQIGPRGQIGPFSHGRPGTRLDEDVHMGNFVETKKAHLMAGAKANHLAYLGDASVGSKANIGAGTITCNYDGFFKHKTTIEAGAFIGSDSQLVAPVTIGRGAFVAAGSTITKDVPRDSLALTRVKQAVVEGWADRFREAQARRKNRDGKSGETKVDPIDPPTDPGKPGDK